MTLPECYSVPREPESPPGSIPYRNDGSDIRRSLDYQAQVGAPTLSAEQQHQPSPLPERLGMTGERESSPEPLAPPQHEVPSVALTNAHLQPTVPRLGIKTTHAVTKIASLNIRGGGSTTTRPKWQQINHLLRTRNIGILAVHEAHLKAEDVISLQNQFPARMHILNNCDEEHPTLKGIAIILNKTLVSWKEATSRNIIPGRATLLTIPWHGGEILHILAVYAPNDHAQNAAFWATLNEEFSSSRCPKPNLMLGDFNMVEEAIDRLPAHRDPPAVVESLEILKDTLSLRDGWRSHFPAELAYSYTQKFTQSRSHIDRIYHQMVMAEFANPRAPYIGKGRWAIPPRALQDPRLLSPASAGKFPGRAAPPRAVFTPPPPSPSAGDRDVSMEPFPAPEPLPVDAVALPIALSNSPEEYATDMHAVVQSLTEIRRWLHRGPPLDAFIPDNAQTALVSGVTHLALLLNGPLGEHTTSGDLGGDFANQVIQAAFTRTPLYGRDESDYYTDLSRDSRETPAPSDNETVRMRVDQAPPTSLAFITSSNATSSQQRAPVAVGFMYEPWL
ncbi:LOW QUALITY PROTEIN: hypothetical protein CVT26_011767, partial [Gymnopilus dilepis]